MDMISSIGGILSKCANIVRYLAISILIGTLLLIYLETSRGVWGDFSLPFSYTDFLFVVGMVIYLSLAVELIRIALRSNPIEHLDKEDMLRTVEERVFQIDRRAGAELLLYLAVRLKLNIRKWPGDDPGVDRPWVYVEREGEKPVTASDWGGFILPEEEIILQKGEISVDPGIDFKTASYLNKVFDRAVRKVVREISPTQLAPVLIIVVMMVAIGLLFLLSYQEAYGLVFQSENNQPKDIMGMVLILADQILKGIAFDLLEFFGVNITPYVMPYDNSPAVAILLALRMLPTIVLIKAVGTYFQRQALLRIVYQMTTQKDKVRSKLSVVA